MKFSVAALISLAASAVYAQTAGVAVNLPSIGQVLTAGTAFTITWTADANATGATINSIALMKGNAANLETVVPNILSSPIPVTPSSYNWNIPSNIETAPSYALAVAGSNGGTTYSTYFTILNNGAGSAPASASASASASGAATSGAATSGAAASGAASQSSNSKSSSSASASPSSATSGASGLKAGLVGAGAVAGTVALLL